MDQDILKKLYAKSADLNKSVDNIDETLGDIYSLQQKEYTEESKERKQKDKDRRLAAQLAKRKEREASGKGQETKKKKKEDKKNFGDFIKDALGGLLGSLKGLLGGLGGLVTAPLGLAMGAIGGVIGGAFSFLGGLLGNLLVGAIKTVGGLLGKAIGGAFNILKAGLGSLKTAAGSLFKGIGAKAALAFGAKAAGAVTIAGGAAVGIAYGAHSISQNVRSNHYGGGKAGEMANQMYGESLRINAYGTNKRGRRTKGLTAEHRAQAKKIKETREELLRLKKERDDALADATTEKTVGQGRSKHKKKVVDEKARDEIMEDYDKKVAELAEKYETKFQDGGMVPTLLEPGEKVFKPGQWDQNVSMLNSLVPRFQVGGVVEHLHGDPTRKGYDKHGHGLVSNAHDHYAFSSKDLRIQVQQKLASGQTASGRSYQIGSTTGGKHATNSYHYSGQAFDIPWSQFGSGAIGSKDYKQSQQLQSDISAIVSELGGSVDMPSSSADTMKGGDDAVTGESVMNGLGNILGDSAKVLGGVGGFMTGFFGEIFNSFGGEGEFKSLLGGLGNGIAGAAGSAVGLGGNLFSGIFGEKGVASQRLNLGGGGGGDYGVSSLKSAMDAAGITNKTERAMFLSQMHHESGGFKYRKEIWGPTAIQKTYEGRSDLGNNQPGDGKRFMGRGYIQLTGRANYKTYGDKIGVDLVNNPELAADPTNAAKIAIAYWENRVNRSAAQKGDVRTVTKNINGGDRGLADRMSQFDHYKAKGYQSGGLVNVRGNNSGLMSRMKEAQEKFAESIAEATSSEPIVVFDDGPSSSVVMEPSANQKLPSLPDGPSTIQAAEYFYNLTLGDN